MRKKSTRRPRRGEKQWVSQSHRDDSDVFENLRPEARAVTVLRGDAGQKGFRAAPRDELRLTHGLGELPRRGSRDSTTQLRFLGLVDLVTTQS